ncbi:MAG TPA: UDP-3-O-(3-hydroxymyristoyl)glucosamine N-acyltransferase [Bryobacterales bacterium]|nr:UDP-3-O-(3-hydroxymyristoyl)glucosamine N-acyltransferase [Bryobacterales bacterium]
MKVGEIARLLGAAAEGDASVEISGVQSLGEAGPADISFAEGRAAEKRAQRTRAGCLLVSTDFDNSSGRTVIRVSKPRNAFARIVAQFHPPRAAPAGADPSARVARSARLGEGVSVGALAVIGENAAIGARTIVGPGSVIGEGVSIGADGLLHAGVTLYAGVRIGERAVLHSGCVIGADGFGFVLENGRYTKFPQVGTVEIGDDVEIGANSCVDRGALGATRIGDGAKLDNLVHIGHNCRIGRHVVIAAQTGLSGGVEVGDYAVIGGQVGIGDKARIESRAVLGSGCGVLTSKIVRAGAPVWGTPARPLKQYLERLALFDRLPQMIEKLEKK